MQRRKACRVVLGISLLLALLASCGDEDSVDISCGDLVPCDDFACNSCGWPNGSCSIPDGALVSASLPDSGNEPFYVIVDIEILSETQGPTETVCQNAEIVIVNSNGTLLTRTLALDQPVNICTTSPVPGLHTVTLVCDDFPTRGRYQASIADATGHGVWP